MVIPDEGQINHRRQILYKKRLSIRIVFFCINNVTLEIDFYDLEITWSLRCTQ